MIIDWHMSTRICHSASERILNDMGETKFQFSIISRNGHGTGNEMLSREIK